MLSIPPPTRVALGTLEVGGQRVDLFLSPEWARYFQSLNTQVQNNSTVITQVAQQTAMLDSESAASDMFLVPPGSPGAKGDPGMALFMLLDDASESSMPAPPGVDLAAPPAIGTAVPAAARFTALTATAGFGCNGKGAQTPVASGGTVAGVIAALVANGILSS